MLYVNLKVLHTLMTLHLGISIKINNQQGLHELAVQVNHRSAADKGAILGEVSLCDLTYT